MNAVTKITFEKWLKQIRAALVVVVVVVVVEEEVPAVDVKIEQKKTFENGLK